MVVKAALAELGLHYTRVDLGQTDIIEDISASQHDQIQAALLKSGLELNDDVRSVLVDSIKKIIIEQVHYSESPLSTRLSVHLSLVLKHNYTYMANVFSETQGYPIERFMIEHKIGRVKELLMYKELNLTEIASKMHYRSVAHLSAQFKKVTGITVSAYKQIKVPRRAMLEAI
jgi:AraC-like DNA-binding protein